MNDAGQVVGSSAPSLAAPPGHAFVFADGVLRELGTLGGRGSQAWGINDAGLIVGAADTQNDAASHAFLYRNGNMQHLGTLGGPESFIYDINEANASVGSAELSDASRARDAVLFDDGVIAGLSTLS